MTAQAPDLSPERTLADLAVSVAGASRVFHRHGLDFCCHGKVSLANACADRELEVDALIAELEREERNDDTRFQSWDDVDLDALIAHILTRYHEPLRAELPRLIAMALKVENVHSEKPACPRGLGSFLQFMQSEIESHMGKEEEVLFPLIISGLGTQAKMPVMVLEREHDDHGQNLAKLRELARNFEAPPEACGTWRALYLGLAELERELMEHIALENNVLFPRALRG
jgi:regulator of cell morphogenesis and NO signaling